MSARIAPEPISIGITMGADYSPRAHRTTRPIEAVAAITADPQQSHSGTRTLADGNRARSGDRPPGKDPSIPPQALFDAALIAAEFKPTLKIELPDPAKTELAMTASPGKTDKAEAEATTTGNPVPGPASGVDTPAAHDDSPATGATRLAP